MQDFKDDNNRPEANSLQDGLHRLLSSLKDMASATNENTTSSEVHNNCEVADNTMKLTLHQEVALQGELAVMLSGARNKEDVPFTLYGVLSGAPPKLKEEVTKILKEITGNEDLVDRTNLQIISGIFPVDIWANKVLADITARVSGDFLNVHSLNKKYMAQSLIKSAFISFIRDAQFICLKSTKALLVATIEHPPLDFLREVAYSLISDIQYGVATSGDTLDYNPPIMSITFNIANTLSLSELNSKPRDIKPLDSQTVDGLTNFVSQPPSEKKFWVVKKINRQEGKVINIKKFLTEEQAENYLRLLKNYPELFENFEFRKEKEN